MKEIIKLSDRSGCGVWHKGSQTRSSLDEAVNAIGSNCYVFSGNMFDMKNPSKPNDAYTIDGVVHCEGGIQFGIAFKPPKIIDNSYLNGLKYPFFLGGSYVRVNIANTPPISGAFAGSSRRASIGLMKDGSSLYIHYTDVNKTVKEMAEEAIRDGCQFWYNLDGGGTVQWHLPNGENYYGTDPKRKALNWWWVRPVFKGENELAIKEFSRAAQGNFVLSPNFLVREFACNDGSDKILVDEKLVSILQRIRELSGNKPIKINSGYRTQSYNTKIGGAKESYHMRGQAADFYVSDIAPSVMAAYAEIALKEAGYANAGGIGMYGTFVHVDTRIGTKWRQNMVTGANVTSFTAVKPTIKLGSTGDSVKTLQTALKISSDGIFGPATEAAVKAYQKSKGLTPDGIVGSMTWSALGF